MSNAVRKKIPRPPDPLGRHIRIYHSMLNSPAWIALSYSAKCLFLDIRIKLNATNNGNIGAVFSELKHRGWKSKTTLHKCLRELETLGFLLKTRQGGIASMSRICSLYRFTDIDCYEFPKLGVPACKPTHDYQRFASIREARAVLLENEQAHKHRKRKKEKVQKLALLSPKVVPVALAHTSRK